ncbi:MAG: hypothetical protein ABSD96_12395 [Candidatus Korobacteraceae bacterium]
MGVALILVGLALPAGTYLWYHTRNRIPVDVPVTLASRHFTTEFELNLNDGYDIMLAVNNSLASQNDLSFRTLNCLLGMPNPTLECDDIDTPSVVEAMWTVSSGTRVVASGSSQDFAGFSGPGRCLGVFHGYAGPHYKLDIDFLKDASRLSALNPRIRVILNTESDMGVLIGCLGVDILAACVGLIGISILLISVVKERRRKNKASEGNLILSG